MQLSPSRPVALSQNSTVLARIHGNASLSWVHLRPYHLTLASMTLACSGDLQGYEQPVDLTDKMLMIPDSSNWTDAARWVLVDRAM
eukprot:scaffold6111_cov186-Prasinococcus_capsulatus_cf.AAC.1